MPLDMGVPDMLSAEYQRFTNALGDLSDGGQRRARQISARCAPDQLAPRAVKMPGWDDVVHVVPRVRVTPEQRASHYDALRHGQDSPLAPELQDELRRLGRRARAMQATPTPEWAKTYGQAMTAIDNVQDFLTTVVTVGRLGLNPMLRALTAVGGAAAISGQGLVGIAMRGTARAIPVLGWVLLAADILKLVNLLGMWAFPFYALWCAGLPAAGAAAVPALVMGRALKLRASQLANLSPFSHKAWLNRARTVNSWRPNIYNLMEVAQTTDALFGFGLSFGGLVGWVTDSAFGAEQKLRGQPHPPPPGGGPGPAARSAAPIGPPSGGPPSPIDAQIHALFARDLAHVPTPELHDRRVAGNVLAGGFIFDTVNETFTAEEHTEALVAQAVAWSFMADWIDTEAMETAVLLALDAPLAPPQYQWENVAAIMQGEGVAPGGFGRWPMPGTPTHAIGENLMRWGAQRAPGALRELLAPLRDDALGALMGAAVVRIAHRSAILFTGSRDAIQFELLPEWQTLESLALARRLPRVDAGVETLIRYFAACAEWLELHNRRQLPLEALETIAERVGQPLLRGLDAEAPVPPGLFVTG